MLGNEKYKGIRKLRRPTGWQGGYGRRVILIKEGRARGTRKMKPGRHRRGLVLSIQRRDFL